MRLRGTRPAGLAAMMLKPAILKSTILKLAILKLTILAFMILAVPCLTEIGNALAADTLVPFGATWKYLDDGSDQGSAWATTGFNAASWAAGPAQLGYGDGDEATVVASGPSGGHYITTYYRHTFPVADPTTYTALILHLLRDDGARIYLNGTEVARSNLPAGTIDHLTVASSTVSGSGEDAVHTLPFASSLLVAGNNLLAVEIHQRSPDSSDTSFDLELIAVTANDPIMVTRGPYLQRVSPTEATICWRTNVPISGRVDVGSAPLGWTHTVTEATAGFDHAVRVTGLTPGTRYYYAIGDGTTPLAGGDLEHRFDTAPTAVSSDPVRIWAIGDSGTADLNAAAVRDAFLALPESNTTDVWLMLGDNAYSTGTDGEYQAAVFDMYPTILRRIPVWPTFGNHDGVSASSATQTGPYYDIFVPPTAAEAGGVASGSESYYSFDHGSVHFVCLDSQGSSTNPNDAMAIWLAADLAATTQEWIIAFWHHPPYTKGSHDSDDPADSGGRMRDMRQDILPILEAGGVDLVLSGHSHSYERSYLIDGHHGLSTTLTPSMVVDGGDGRVGGDGPYIKNSNAPNAGAVYIVAGSSGKTSGGPLDHAAMYLSLNQLGSVVIQVDGPQLDVRFLRETGAIADTFQITKDEPFIRSDANSDGNIDLSDPVRILGHLFLQETVHCLRALDANADTGVDVSDVVVILSYLFSSGTPPPPPFPSCGLESAPTLACDTFPACP